MNKLKTKLAFWIYRP